jgi:hypothetical protein
MLTYIVENSSILSKLLYNELIHQLIVEYKSGKRYMYDQVSLEEYNNFCKTKNRGKYMNDHFKTKPYKKIQ